MSALNDEQIRSIITEGLSAFPIENKNLLFLIPDKTRSGPWGYLIRLILSILNGHTKRLDFLIALGTHPPLTEPEVHEFTGLTEFPENTEIFNHIWDQPDNLHEIGILQAEQINEITGGILNENVSVKINKLVLNYDHIIILGPVFPHEVVGFSGGLKYFFPGSCGPEFLNLFHWLGACLTNLNVNGQIHTPVRHLINEAGKLLPVPVSLIALNIYNNKVQEITCGDIHSAWEKAARNAARTHIIHLKKRYKLVIGIAPEFYDDLWTAGKVMYKLEGIVQDGGELVIYAPHIREISRTHGKILKNIGYHCLKYFLAQPDKFRDIPKGILAHSTHVKGLGSFNSEIEKSRIRVSLCTDIPEKLCTKINLSFRDPVAFNPEDYKNREEESILVIDQAGEILYKYKDS